jgi:hypothetical protein
MKSQNTKREKIDPDNFTVFNLKADWEKKMADIWTADEIRMFKERQELLNTIPLEQRARTKLDESYREGWVDAAIWIHQEMKKVFRSLDEKK